MIDMMRGFFEEKTSYRAFDWLTRNQNELTKDHLVIYLKTLNKALERAGLEKSEISKDRELIFIDILIGLKALEQEKTRAEVVKQDHKYVLRFFWS